MGRLAYASHAIIHFEDRSYRWIDLKRFSWQMNGRNDDVLAELIQRPEYRDHYLSPDSHEQDAGPIHGPYRLDAIYPACFQPISPSEAVATVGEFCDLHPRPPNSGVRDRIDSLVLSPMRSAECYRLRELPDAKHQIGDILSHFRELVGISRDTGEVLLVVMASD
jgi:hypothetical protein